MIVVERGTFTGQLVELSRRTITIGRSSKNQLSLKGAAGVSRVHCQVAFDEGRYFITDLGSRNGTIVNGVEIQGAYPLADGDLIEISDEAMRFSQPDGIPADALADRETFVLDPAARPPVDRRAPAPRLDVDLPSNDLELTPAWVPAPTPSTQNRVLPPPIVPAADDVLPVLDLKDAQRQRTLSETGAILREVSMESRKKSSFMFLVGGLVGLVFMLGALFAWDTTLNDGAFFADLSAWAAHLAGEDEPRPVEPRPDPAPPDASPPAVPGADAGPAGRPDAGADDEEEDEDTPPLEPEPDASAGTLYSARAARTGKVTRTLVKAGAHVDVGAPLLSIDATSSRVRRKLAALAQEERVLQQAAAQGRAQAQKDLKEVRAERKVWGARERVVTVRAKVAGTVKSVAVRRGQRVKRGATVVVIVPD